MKYILIIFIFTSFLFSQVAVVNYNNSIDQVEEIDKNDPRISSNPNNILAQENTQMIENELNNNKQVKQFDENDPRVIQNR